MITLGFYITGELAWKDLLPPKGSRMMGDCQVRFCERPRLRCLGRLTMRLWTQLWTWQKVSIYDFLSADDASISHRPSSRNLLYAISKLQAKCRHLSQPMGRDAVLVQKSQTLKLGNFLFAHCGWKDFRYILRCILLSIFLALSHSLQLIHL